MENDKVREDEGCPSGSYMDNGEQPLLSTGDREGQLTLPEQEASYDDDIDPITGVKDLLKKSVVESKKLWRLAGPAILLYLCQYSLDAVAQLFAGHVGVLQLAALAYQNLVVSGFASAVLVYPQPLRSFHAVDN